MPERGIVWTLTEILLPRQAMSADECCQNAGQGCQFSGIYSVTLASGHDTEENHFVFLVVAGTIGKLFWL